MFRGELISSTFHRKQASIIERELLVGHTLLGPQRDDWRLEDTLIQRDLGTYGSRGEQRMAVIFLKQAQLAHMQKVHGQTALFLLDDVLSELDAGHQQQLLQTLGCQQTLLTTASLSDVSPTLLREASVYEKIGQSWLLKA